MADNKATRVVKILEEVTTYDQMVAKSKANPDRIIAVLFNTE